MWSQCTEICYPSLKGKASLGGKSHRLRRHARPGVDRGCWGQLLQPGTTGCYWALLLPGGSGEGSLTLYWVLDVWFSWRVEYISALACFNMKDSSSFNLSGTDPTASCGSSDGASTNESHMTNPPSPPSILLSNPDLIQSETDAARTTTLYVRNQSFVQEKNNLYLPQKHHCNN